MVFESATSKVKLSIVPVVAVALQAPVKDPSEATTYMIEPQDGSPGEPPPFWLVRVSSARTMLAAKTATAATDTILTNFTGAPPRI
jgi:hypothetical protein